MNSEDRGRFRFGEFLLDPGERALDRGGARVDLNARYFDALLLLVREQGRLVSKDRFLEEVWRGVPVTDEALTQCIRTLRRTLGDDAARPRFIETVPKHGYRFLAPVQWSAEGEEIVAGDERSRPSRISNLLLTGAAAALGGGAAGAIGGLFYGLALSAQPMQAGMGAASVLLVLVCVTLLVGLLGGAGIGLGMAGAGLWSGRLGPWTAAGAALGGLVVGAAVKLLGLDAFLLLLGRSPGGITGAAEGLALGAAVGLSVWWGSRIGSLRRTAAAAALVCGAAGILISLAGGRLMGGSLDLLAGHFPDSRLSLDPIAGLLGESRFGPLSQAVTAGLEAALFGGCVAVALLAMWRRSGPSH